MKHLPGPCRLPDPLGYPLSLGCPWAAVPPGVPKEALDLPHRMSPELGLGAPPGGGPGRGSLASAQGQVVAGGGPMSRLFSGASNHTRETAGGVIRDF